MTGSGSYHLTWGNSTDSTVFQNIIGWINFCGSHHKAVFHSFFFFFDTAVDKYPPVVCAFRNIFISECIQILQSFLKYIQILMYILEYFVSIWNLVPLPQILRALKLQKMPLVVCMYLKHSPGQGYSGSGDGRVFVGRCSLDFSWIPMPVDD